ncbi:MAG TPA: type III-A CRISPR-associated RAMP protein Csm4 [Candidatus Acidoferrum sp.]|nr:type III-A CRISPR-associated RAMP protein Csm4 [Candidatus Acidoferrum sp.]
MADGGQQEGTFVAYRLSPRGPFRFGERGIGLEETAGFPRSDTLFSAIVSAWRLMEGPQRTEERLAAFPAEDRPDADPPFAISSAFPYAGAVRLLPRPLVRFGRGDSFAKAQKDVAFVSWARMEDLMRSEILDEPHVDDLRQGGVVWIHPADIGAMSAMSGSDLWAAGESATIPRVTIDRATSASALYFQGQVWFAAGCGLYFLARFRGDHAEEFQGYVEGALEMLGMEGLGGRRSAGLGRFEVSDPEDVTLSIPRDAGTALLLGLYHPTLREVTDGILDGARYRLITRRGWIASPDDNRQRRKSVRMMCEGSLLRRPPVGQLASVAPDGFPHPVYRSGLALTIRCPEWLNA